MATIQTTFAIVDHMTRPLQAMNRGVSTLVSAMEAADSTFSNSFDRSILQNVREDLAAAAAGWDQIEQEIGEAGAAQENFRQNIENTSSAADALGNKLKGILATVVSIAGVKMGLNWAKENMELADIQRNAENQLAAVLGNMGGSQVDYQAILDKAVSIQGRGVYGDEAMIAGAAEFATYFSDTEAIISMMDTLSNYAMGMSATEGNGLALDSAAMVQYATNLGKVMTGTYTAMSQKGFKFTDAQKAIIEGTATQAQIVEALGAEYVGLSSDMQAAAAINSVIGEAWDGLYDTMSNTPEGKIKQFDNTLGDLRETLGNQIYPYVLKVYDGFTQNFPQIEMVLTSLTILLGNIVLILGALTEGALNVATVIGDNWGWIAPLVMGIVGAILAYQAAVMIMNAIEWLSTSAKIAGAIASGAKTVALNGETIATSEAAMAQWGLNTAILACPVFWIIAGIIALIAVIYAVVGAINKFAGTSVSATGIIAGVFAALGAHLINTFVVPVWNQFAAIANFFGNVFNDPVAAVKVLFYDMCLTVIGYIANLAHAIEDLLNKIPGVTVDITSGLDNFYKGLEEAQQKVKDESGWVEYVQKMDFVDYSDAFNAGYEFGEGVEDTLSSLFTIPSLDDLGFDSMDAFNLGTVVDGIAGNSADTAGNTAKMADTLDYMEEDLKWMLDIAEREAINRFTTAEITVEQTNHNTITQDTDLDGIMDAWAADFAEKLDISEEGIS